MNDEFEAPQWSLHQSRRKQSEPGTEIISLNLVCKKSCTLANYINENPKAADLKWSLFCAACNSYRFDSVLKPFPPFFLEQEENKQIERVREVIESCPSFPCLLKELNDYTANIALVDLLYWVLIHLSEPSFKIVPKDEQQEILCQASSVMPAAMPDYMFSVTYGSRHQQKFAHKAMNRTTKLAFHGSRLDNFYSIVNQGLQISFNKVAAFGPGIYLSSEMGISLPYSRRGFTWNSSCFGSHISVVALCEVIDHPEVRTESDSNKNTTLNLFNICGSYSVPGKYFIVENNDLVRIKYLLVYGGEESESALLLESPTLLGWIKRHKMFTFIAAYVILLLGIGSSNSSLIHKYYKRFLRKFEYPGS